MSWRQRADNPVRQTLPTLWMPSCWCGWAGRVVEERVEAEAAAGVHLFTHRRRLYEALHPETLPVRERGGPGRGQKTNAESALVSFTADTAAKTGRGRRTIERRVA